IDRREGHLAVGYHRGDDAHEIDIFASDEGAPVAFNIWDAKLARDFFRMFAARAGDCDQAPAFAIRKSGNLRRTGKTRTDDSNVNSIFHENVCSYGSLI